MSEDVEQHVLVHVDQIDLVQHMVVEQQLDNNVPLLTLITKSELNSSPQLAAACLSLRAQNPEWAEFKKHT